MTLILHFLQKLHIFAGEFRSYKALIAAQYNGVSLVCRETALASSLRVSGSRILSYPFLINLIVSAGVRKLDPEQG